MLAVTDPLRSAVLTYAVAASVFEIELPHEDPADRLIAATAAGRGRLPRLDRARLYASLPLRAAALVDELAMACFETDLPHRDPADRFLAATATVYDLTFVTADRRLLDCPSLATVSASA